MFENRKSDRTLILQTARIRAVGETDQIDCAILNISQTGACILVPPEVVIAEAFELAIDGEEAIRSCKLVWQEGARIGAVFANSEDRASLATR
jgi:hypothetical protein